MNKYLRFTLDLNVHLKNIFLIDNITSNLKSILFIKKKIVVKALQNSTQNLLSNAMYRYSPLKKNVQEAKVEANRSHKKQLQYCSMLNKAFWKEYNSCFFPTEEDNSVSFHNCDKMLITLSYSSQLSIVIFSFILILLETLLIINETLSLYPHIFSSAATLKLQMSIRPSVWNVSGKRNFLGL